MIDDVVNGFHNDKNLFHYTFKSLYHIIPAIIFGVSIDKLFIKLQSYYNNPLIILILQLLFSVFVVYLIEEYIAVEYALEWQAITPGLFFSALFFSTQTNIYKNIEKIVG